jgi:hypothetical protein
MADNEWRAALRAKVADAIWTTLERQAEMGWVDRDNAIIDIGHADSINMNTIADAAIDTVLAAFDPPF